MGDVEGKALVLVVDDDELVQRALARMLRTAGIAVETVSDGEAALARIAGSPAIDLVLLDLQMPKLDGHEVLGRLRADPRLRYVPVVVISGANDTPTVARCIELGADDFLVKPFDDVLLHARVRSSLERKRLHDIEKDYLRRLEVEEEKSRLLIASMLPRPVARRLKEGADVVADHFEDVAVLFADLVGFTRFSAENDPATVVSLLNDVFHAFDQIVAKHGLEKIKTIGDAYLAVGGLPEPMEGHVAAVAAAGLAMLGCVEDGTTRGLGLRVGMHRGPVIAGVISADKPSYDLWGDTVNVASRMESHGEVGRVQVSASVREALADRYAFESHDSIHVEGHGEVPTFHLLGPLPKS